MLFLDSSAIAVILRRLRGKAAEIIRGGATLDLAGYELGNVVWKECVLKGSTTLEEAVKRAEDVAKILEIMRIESVEYTENFVEVMKISARLKITFYDASYLHIAKKNDFTLITGDKELEEKANEINVEAISTDEFLSKR